MVFASSDDGLSSGAGFHTRAIHAHQAPDPVTGAVITPIYQTTTFAQQDAGVHKGFDYSRSGNPTRAVLEGVLASLEGGRHGFCFASGLGALTTLSLALLSPGDHVLVSDDVYGGTFRFFSKVFQRFGILVEFLDMADPARVAAALRPHTRMLYLETPTNPLLKLADIGALVAVARQAAQPVVTVVDNTFATPYLQTPLALGVDVVLHSTTKYIGGHSDVVGGALVLRDDTYREAIAFHQNSLGATPDPMAAWLTLRGLKTLGVRMQAHCQNAQALAEFLAGHPAIETVLYPGLPSHPQQALAQRQMPRGYGGMITLRVRGGEAEARRVMQASRLFTLAESLGGVESLIEHPARMTHGALGPEVRQKIGITDNLLRLSVGIEDLDDLREDLAQALAAAVPVAR
jgi:cystathionine beta-lyase/cystathionine gamma-synthase